MYFYEIMIMAILEYLMNTEVVSSKGKTLNSIVFSYT